MAEKPIFKGQCGVRVEGKSIFEGLCGDRVEGKEFFCVAGTSEALILLKKIKKSAVFS